MNDSELSKYHKIAGDAHTDTAADPPVFSPESERAMCDLVRAVRADNKKIRIVGAGTFPVPETEPDTVSISTGSLSLVREINADDYLVIVQSGAIVDRAVHAAGQHGLYVPLDVISGNRSTIGGAYMTAAHGPNAAGHGPFGESVIGVRCINAAGEMMTFGGRTMKNVTGYEMTRFLTGTMGIFVLTSELTIKARPMPELRRMVVADFRTLSDVQTAIRSLKTIFDDAVRVELTAMAGTGGNKTLAVGFEGFRGTVTGIVDRIAIRMDEDGAENIRSQGFDKYMNDRRNTAEHIARQGMYTISVPPASSGVFLNRIHAVSPNIPVAAHLKTGRFHVVCRGAEDCARLADASSAIGGKRPREWDFLRTKGIKSILTAPERIIVKSLKEVMDPVGIYNPNLCIWNTKYLSGKTNLKATRHVSGTKKLP